MVFFFKYLYVMGKYLVRCTLTDANQDQTPVMRRFNSSTTNRLFLNDHKATY